MANGWLEGLLSVDEIKEILESANDGLIVLDAKGNFRYCNPLVFKLTGYSPEELMGQTFKKVVTQEQMKIVTEHFEAHAAGKVTSPYEMDVLCKGGKRLPIEVNTAPLRVRGAVVGVIGIVRDITERKKADAALRQSEAKYRALFDTASDMMFINDFRGFILDANKAMLEAAGLTLEEIRGKNVMDLSPPEDAARIPDLLKSLPQSGKVNFETFGLGKDGVKIPLDVSATVIDYDGKPAIFNACRDMSARKEAEGATKRRLQFEKTISYVTSRFAKEGEPDREINGALADIGVLSGSSRASLVMFSGTEPRASIRNEWCAPGVSPQRQRFQDVDISRARWWLDRFRKGEMVLVADASKLGDEAKFEKELLASQNIRSVIAIPIFIDREAAGFLAFDNIARAKEWTSEDTAALKIAASAIGNAVARARADERLRKNSELLRATLDSTADGILVVDADGKVLASNAPFTKMWRIPKALIDTHDDKTLLDFVLSQLSDPQAFIAKVQELYKSDRTSFDTLLFKDGRVFERFSEPLLDKRMVAGRVWSFRDVTEKRKMENELRARIAELEAQLGAGKKL